MITQRRNKLIEYLKENKNVSLDELCEKFNVSKSTIRRDIDEIEAYIAVKKVYGGVSLIEDEKALPVSVRSGMLKEEKEKIGKEASSLVNDGDSIIIDAGTTTLQMIKYLKNKKNITVVTNSILAINEAILCNNLNIIVSGGHLINGTNSLAGSDGINTVKNLNCKSAFISATGVSIEKGLSNAFLLEAEIKRAMIKCAGKLILMADHTKFDLVSLVTFAALSSVSTIITDVTPNEDYIEYFNKNNIELIIAK